MRGVIGGGYLAQIKEYEAEPIKPEIEGYRTILIGMTEEYKVAVKKVTETNNNEFIDFHARRIVEMAGFTIMGYLLLLDCNRDHNYWKTLEIFLKFARSQNAQRADFIKYSTVNDLGKFKIE